ncbi:hypothetical protein BP6252_06404 [Coleophoma cylindrospora]|uniref:Uncharacterized protein n=1 Tax=Coleophoma cylindrospora TaxID=1849047 RepID=A0A3D8RMF1_9HELO|nr:hypothetical protein BP6252_06404 [Coleophoma cylindrospora]
MTKTTPLRTITLDLQDLYYTPRNTDGKSESKIEDKDTKPASIDKSDLVQIKKEEEEVKLEDIPQHKGNSESTDPDQRARSNWDKVTLAKIKLRIQRA